LLLVKILLLLFFNLFDDINYKIQTLNEVKKMKVLIFFIKMAIKKRLGRFFQAFFIVNRGFSLKNSVAFFDLRGAYACDKFSTEKSWGKYR